jgi:hypothetical protein
MTKHGALTLLLYGLLGIGASLGTVAGVLYLLAVAG